VIDEFLDFLRVITSSRRFHQFAVVVHVIGLAFFLWCYSQMPSWIFGIFAGWSCWFGAHSSMVLLAKGKAK